MNQLSLLSVQEYATSQALILPQTLTRERWEALGAELKHVDSAVQWWVGDWWAHGEREWGVTTALGRRDRADCFAWYGPGCSA